MVYGCSKSPIGQNETNPIFWMATRADKGNTWAREQGNRGTREQVNKAIGEQENRGRRKQSSLCTDTPSPQKKIGKRDVCESPSLIVFRCIFAYFFCCFFSGGRKSVDRATRLRTLVIYRRVCYALEDFNTYMFDFLWFWYGKHCLNFQSKVSCRSWSIRWFREGFMWGIVHFLSARIKALL